MRKLDLIIVLAMALLAYLAFGRREPAHDDGSETVTIVTHVE